MDWAYVIGTAAASVASSVILAIVIGGFLLRIRFERLEESTQNKFTALYESTDQKFKALDESMEQRFENTDEVTKQRVDDYKLWRAGLEQRLNDRASHLAEHEKECRERWEKLLLEHGGILERLRSIDEMMKDQRNSRRRI